LQYYELKEEWKGSHCEGSVFVTLFSLLFWDILFADVPHVFQTPYQGMSDNATMRQCDYDSHLSLVTALKQLITISPFLFASITDSPLDLGTDAFYPSRQWMIDDRLEKLQANRDGYLERLLLLSWRYKGIQCRGVNWERYLGYDRLTPLSLSSNVYLMNRNTFPELVTIANCVGGVSLCSIFSAFAKDYRKYTAGMPDLLLWNVEKSELPLSFPSPELLMTLLSFFFHASQRLRSLLR